MRRAFVLLLQTVLIPYNVLNRGRMLVPVMVLLPPAGGPGIVLRVGNVDRHSLIGRDRVWENLPSASVYALKIGRTLFLCGCHLARIPEENHKENAHH